MPAANIDRFVRTVAEIEQNSWWVETFRSGKVPPPGFTISWSGESTTITDVPTEAFESLLLRVRRLTMNDSAENMHVIRKKLKASASHDYDRELLDVWYKYWRIAFVKTQFEIEVAGERHSMTPYRVYDCFINGEYFHSDQQYTVILGGNAQRSASYLFARNVLHAVVTDLCLAAIGLRRYIDNGATFSKFVLHPGPSDVFEFILFRKRVAELDEQYKLFNQDIGDCKKARWG